MLNVGGRGAAGHALQLPVEIKWVVRHIPPPPQCGPTGCQPSQQEETKVAVPNGWNTRPRYSLGSIFGRNAADPGSRVALTGSGGNVVCEYYTSTLTRLTFVGPDGTETEMYDQLNGGKPLAQTCQTTPLRGKVFVTRDGTAATFISDTDIYDGGTAQFTQPLSGYLITSDGTRRRIVNSNVVWVRDRNGNMLTATFDSNNQVTAIADSLNRQMTITYATSTIHYDTITFKGTGGAPRTIRIYYDSLSNVLRSGSTIKTFLQLFPNLNGSSSSQFNPTTMVSAVELPDGRQYTFKYNSYAELARVDLPTGGHFEYDFLAAGGVPLTDNVYHELSQRRVYQDASSTSLQSKTDYSAAVDDINGHSIRTVDQRNAAGALLSREKHYFHNVPYTDPTINGSIQTAYSPPLEGREYMTESYDDDGTTLLRKVEHTWTSTAGTGGGPSTNPRITQTLTMLSDSNQVAKQTFNYDQYNNQTDVYEYNYGVGAAGSLVRRTSTTYLTSNVVNGTTYNYDTDTSIHLRNLPTQISIYNAAGVEQARATYEYDNYTATANHAGLTARTGISGLDSAYTTAKKTRGNVTAVTRYLLDAVGSVTGSISIYQQYDVAGNTVKSIDGEGHVTTSTFTDSYGGPDAEARLNSGPQELVTQSGTQQSYAFPSLVINDLGQKLYTQHDYYTGQVVDEEDPNGVTSSSYYDDDLDRPTKVIRAASDEDLQNQTLFTYDDTLRVITTTSDFDAHNDPTPVKSQVLFDGLGRTTETRTFETASTYIAVRKTYDALGRSKQVSNPFRSGTPVWTTTAYDALGRVISVTTPDSAAITTSYSGNTVTVTDQTGRDRQSALDALGRLTQVIEDPGTGGLGYVTDYTYDVLGNLRKVVQGSQLHYFMYDSLSRLIRVKNPEQSANASLALTDPVTSNAQWSIAYTYDDDNNLSTRTDARNLATTYTYDGLNRNTSITYKSGTVVQARVVRTYDTAPNGVGRPATASSYIDAGTNVGANSQTIINSYDAMGRPLSQSQYFYANGSWGTAFTTQRTYNLAGVVTSQTYPSGRVVNYTYDLAGRASGFTGNLGDGVTRNYATTITYDQWGGLSREKFGTTTALYHKERRNIRGQLYDMRLSTVNDADNWNRGAVINHYTQVNYGFGNSGTDNNGNLLFQQHWVPNDDAITSSNFMQQNYDYDQLNRIKWVAEYPDGNAAGSTGAQWFGYDRYGNRNIETVSGGTGINTQQFTVNVGNKNQYGVPTGQTGVMQYDAAGNLYNDTYSGTGSRTFDFENRIVTATNAGSQQSVYTYDADGQRVRRKSYGVETWQVYGMEGGLLAEYEAGDAPAAPQKEYGYRNGQLLVTAEAVGRENVALASAGGVATASSQLSTGAAPSGAINGDRRGISWGSGGGWCDAASTPFPDWLQVDFSGTKTIDEIDVVGLQDGFATLEPTETMTFTQYGLTDFEVQYWNGSAWVTVSGGSVTGNDKVWRKFTFPAVSTSKVRVNITGGGGGRARVVELEAWQAASSSADVRWMVEDHLGTPRMIADKTGSLAGISRHDYLPFGEELLAGTGNRTAAHGYRNNDGVRQQFTQYERDAETGLDYAQARYYSNSQGRFTSPDPYNILFEMKKGKDQQEQAEMLHVYLMQPQNWDRYAYSLNNPLKHTDPDGRRPPTKEENQAIQTLLALAEQATAQNNAELATGLFSAAVELSTAISGLGDGQHDKGIDIAVGAILNIGNSDYATSATVTIRDRNGTGITIGEGNKCNVFVAGAHVAAGINFKANGSRGRGYPLTSDNKPPAANWLGDRRDVQHLSNLPVQGDGSLRVGDIVAWRYNEAADSGHSSIYIGGNVVVYAGSSSNDGIPKAATLNNVDSSMSAHHESHVVRRYNGKP